MSIVKNQSTQQTILSNREFEKQLQAEYKDYIYSHSPIPFERFLIKKLYTIYVDSNNKTPY